MLHFLLRWHGPQSLFTFSYPTCKRIKTYQFNTIQQLKGNGANKRDGSEFFLFFFSLFSFGVNRKLVEYYWPSFYQINCRPSSEVKVVLRLWWGWSDLDILMSLLKLLGALQTLQNVNPGHQLRVTVIYLLNWYRSLLLVNYLWLVINKCISHASPFLSLFLILDV